MKEGQAWKVIRTAAKRTVVQLLHPGWEGSLREARARGLSVG